ncbi:MAG TPA: M48 family metallopeptidase [Myxococcota bacterium]|nr:M48 family metallopeptidase [Myxococcota bacterium]
MVRARYFDGRTSRAREVVLRPQGTLLVVEGEGVRALVPPQQVRVGESLGRAGRRLGLPGGASCEVEPGPELDLLLELLGHRDGRVSRWQRSLRIALASAVATLAVLGAGYRWGLPWAAARVARALPEAWVQQLDTHTLDTLDENVFGPTALPREARERVAARLAALRPARGELPPHGLHFRAGGSLGANAFALPGGEIVVTDELVLLSERDEELLGVLAHELGHVHERHALRGVIQSSVVGALVAVWLGDVSSLATALPAAVLDARYSRDFEREADDYAAELLRANGADPIAFAEFLARLEAADGGGGGPAPTLLAYLASHPATAERIRRLRGDR